jgi:hypothetical protein
MVTKAPTVVNVHVKEAVLAMPPLETAPAAIAIDTDFELLNPVKATTKFDPEIVLDVIVAFVAVIFVASATARVPVIEGEVIGKDAVEVVKGWTVPFNDD